jgi:hypothetical protein
VTAYCSGNPGEARPEFGAFVYMGPAALAAMLNNVPVAWAVPLAVYLGAITYELSTFCTSEPPTVPTITAGDVFNLIAIENPVGHAEAIGKFAALIGAYMWPQLCRCTVVATPAAPTPPAAPTGLPNINPGLPGSPPTAAPCLILDTGQQSTTSTTEQAKLGPFSWPAGATGFRQIADTVSGGVTGLAQYSLMANTTNTTTGWSYYGFNLGGTAGVHQESSVGTVNLPKAFNWLTMKVSTGTLVGRQRLEVYCGGQLPNSPIPNCGCPPDPVLSAQLQQVLDLVRLIQRQGVPFAYVAGATHAGLSGNDSLAVADLIGVRVNVTTLPDSYGRASGEPDEFFDLGFLTWGTTDGYRTSTRLEHASQLILPPLAGVYTVLGYSLAPGVVITITELVREP